MNFYKHFIGDFNRDTSHLSLTERGAYLALLHHYYATEHPLPADHNSLCRIAGAHTKSERDAVSKVMAFFEVCDSGLMHKRVEAELERAGKQADTNRAIAHAREARRKAVRKQHESCNEPSDDSCTNLEPSHSQIKDIPPTAGETPPIDGQNEDATKRLFDLGVDVLTRAGHTERAARAFIGKVRQTIGDERAIGVLLAAQKTTDPAGYVTKAVKRESTKRVQLC
jgi:uncharacterized protein YdaU (DUF1376 family)